MVLVLKHKERFFFRTLFIVTKYLFFLHENIEFKNEIKIIKMSNQSERKPENFWLTQIKIYK